HTTASAGGCEIVANGLQLRGASGHGRPAPSVATGAQPCMRARRWLGTWNGGARPASPARMRRKRLQKPCNARAWKIAWSMDHHRILAMEIGPAERVRSGPPSPATHVTRCNNSVVYLVHLKPLR